MDILRKDSPQGSYQVITATGSSYRVVIGDEVEVTRLPRALAPSEGWGVFADLIADGEARVAHDFIFQVNAQGMITWPASTLVRLTSPVVSITKID